ncbi:type IV secretory system conjugative DNA transfer family protein [Peristeroidobacter soli]|uniref:type IV secretory system conjugative DNA transfer family protein n=1 Tax=Peristeroidobacter soli TaxID=2497877 RepID=UPI001C378A2F|nr:type IV secretory system conjugative DNA transfer family protein [Peristeroidobacter soli]
MYGAAQFEHRRAIKRAGLLGDDGILLGELFGRYLILPGQQGVALAARPRGGKGVAVVVPNLLNWPGSSVSVDIKRENWTITAGYRAAQGHDCFLFDPLSESGFTAAWNPLDYVSSNPHLRVNDLQRIGSMLYPEVPGTDPFWIASARSLFLGIALYLFESPSLPKTVGEILRQGMASDDEGFGAHWRRIIQGRNSGRFPLSSACVRALYDVIDLAPVTASSVRKTFTSRLDLWLNPLLDRATSSSDFDLRDLRRRPMSIYVAVNPDDLHRLRPVLSLFFEQAIGLQTRVLPQHDPSLKFQVLMLLDECPALGRIPILSEAISYVPGYNVRVVMVFQAPSQLREVYGQENSRTMMKSLGARIVFAPKDFEDAREISEELGDTTVRVRSRSRPEFGGWGLPSRGATISVSEQKRPLLLPQEVKELGGDEEIVFCEELRPIRAQKICYWRDPRFVSRLLPAPTLPQPARCASLSSAEAHLPISDSRPESVLMDSSIALFPVPADGSARSTASADRDRPDNLTLEDFGCDFSQVEFPTHDGPWSDAEMQTAVDSFMAALETR